MDLDHYTLLTNNTLLKKIFIELLSIRDKDLATKVKPVGISAPLKSLKPCMLSYKENIFSSNVCKTEGNLEL